MKEQKSWGTIIRVFKRYFIAELLCISFIEAAIYVGMHSCSPYLMFPYILMGSVTGLYGIIGGAVRAGDVCDNDWPVVEECRSCARLESKLSALTDDRNSLHKALAELEVK